MVALFRMVPKWKSKCPSTRMDKENVVYPYCGELFDNSYCNMDESQKHYAKQKMIYCMISFL